ncbi:TPA: tape measure protein, partial [Escherichia coli]|nr:tape measure protein [Escherichia coli]
MSGKSLGTLTLDLVTRTASFISGMGRAEREISRWGKSISREMESASRDVRSALAGISGQITAMGSVATGVTGALAGAFTAGNLISMADEWASVNARLKLATQSTTEFSSSQQALMDISQRTGTAFSDSAALFTRASASLREYGYGADDVLKVTEAISTGLKLSGAGAAETSSVITQFSQALAAGVLRGQDFNSVNQSGDRIIRALAAGMGVARKDLKAMADQGKLTTDTVVPALISQLGTLRDEYAAVPDSVSGSITKVENALMAWVGGANDASGATRTLSGVLDAVAKNMDGVATAAGVMVAVGVSRWTGSLVSGVVSAGAALVKAEADEKALAEAQLQGTKAASARAQAAVYRAQKALAAADSAEKQAAAEKRLAAAQATLTRNREASAAAQAKLNSLTSTGSRLMSSALGLVGGIPGLVMLGATAWYTMYQNQEQARESARQYVDTLSEINQQIPQMTLPEASDNLDRSRDALAEQNRLVDEQKEKVAALQKQVEDLQYAAQNGGSNGALSWAGMSDAALMNESYITRFLTPAETATRELEEATAQLATEQARLTQMQEKSQSVQDTLASLEQRRTDLIRQQAAEENSEYQSLLMMNGAHTEFNRLLGLGNDLLQQRQGLGAGSVPLRLPQAELDDKQQNALAQMRQQLELSKLKGADRERARLGYAADALGLTGDSYQTARSEYISAGMSTWQNSQTVKKTGSRTGKSEAEKTEETYRRMIAQQKEQLALAGQDTELAKVKYRISQGELATLTETQKQTLLN